MMDAADWYWMVWLGAFLALELPAAIWRRDWTLSVHVWEWFDVGQAVRYARTWFLWLAAGGPEPSRPALAAGLRWLVLAGLLSATLAHFLAGTSARPIVAFGVAGAVVIASHYRRRRST